VTAVPHGRRASGPATVAGPDALLAGPVRTSLLEVQVAISAIETGIGVDTRSGGQITLQIPAYSGLIATERASASHHIGCGTTSPRLICRQYASDSPVLTRLAEERAKLVGLRLRSPGGLHLDEDRHVTVDPDIVLTDGKSIRAAIDAKYKREDPEADVYQALAYAKALNLPRVALVYPGDGEVTPTTHRIRHDDTTILVRTIPVGHGGAGFVNLERRAERVMSDLIAELVGVSVVSSAA
jgi:McrBC 5-methylcytosine restriction system component